MINLNQSAQAPDESMDSSSFHSFASCYKIQNSPKIVKQKTTPVPNLMISSLVNTISHIKESESKVKIQTKSPKSPSLLSPISSRDSITSDQALSKKIKSLVSNKFSFLKKYIKRMSVDDQKSLSKCLSSQSGIQRRPSILKKNFITSQLSQSICGGDGGFGDQWNFTKIEKDNFSEKRSEMSSSRNLKSSRTLRKSIMSNSGDLRLKQGKRRNSKRKSELVRRFTMSRIINQDYELACQLFEFEFEQGSEESEQSSLNTSDSEQQEHGVSLRKIHREYDEKIQRDIDTDPYFLVTSEVKGWKKIKLEYQQYFDAYRLLKLRKFLVFASNTVCYGAQILAESKLFKLLMFLVIIANLALSIQLSMNRFSNQRYYDLQNLFVGIYIFELLSRILANGLFMERDSFLRKVGNIYDLLTLTLYVYYLYWPQQFGLDITPLRLVRSLSYIAPMFEGLQMMLTAIEKSITHLVEVLGIVFILLVFFAAVGMHLFKNIHYNRCMHEETGFMQDTSTWLGCGFYPCPENFICVRQLELLQICTNFNNVEFAFAQLLRTIGQDDWTAPMYFNMRSFHPQVWIFYLAVIFIVHHFAFNMLIAVLKTYYGQVANEYEKQLQQGSSETQIILPQYNLPQLKRQGLQEFFKDQQSIFQNMNGILIRNSSSVSQISTQNSKQAPNQPRTLLGEMQKKEQFLSQAKQGPWMKLLGYLEQLNMKTILLPNLWLLKKNILLRIRQKINVQTLQKIMEISNGEILAYQTEVLYKKSYQTDNHIDVLAKENSKEANQKKKFDFIQHCRSHTLKMYYPLYLDNFHNDQIIQRERFRLPIFHRKKLQGRSTSRTIATKAIKFQSLSKRQLLSGLPALDYDTESESSDVFSGEETNKCIKIGNEYLDYGQIKKLMKQKLGPIRMHKTYDESDQEERYYQMRRKENQKGYVKSKNWSGKNVKTYQNPDDQLRRENIIAKQLNRYDLDIWLVGVLGYIRVLRKNVRNYMRGYLVTFFFDLLVFLNMTFLVFDGIIDDDLIDMVTNVVTVILLLEKFLLLIAFNAKRFLKSSQHTIETIVLLMNIIHIIHGFDNQQSLAKLFRAGISIMMFRLLNYIPFAVIVFEIAKKTFTQFCYMTFLLIFMLFQFAVMGTQLYSGKFDQSSQLGQLHSFDDPIKGFSTVLNTMSNDDWYGVLWMGIEINQTYALIYSYSMMIIINYCTFGLVIAVILDGFSQYMDQKEEEQERKKTLQGQQTMDGDPVELSEGNESSSEDGLENDLKINNVPVVDIQTLNENSPSYQSPNSGRDAQEPDSGQIKTKKVGQSWYQTQPLTLYDTIANKIATYEKMLRPLKYPFDGVKCDTSLYIFDFETPFRQLILALTRNIYQSFFIDIVLTTSCMMFILKTYNEDLSPEVYEALVTIQSCCNIIIIIEVILKTIALGMWLDPGSYFNVNSTIKYQNIWKVTDFIYSISYFLNTEYLVLRLPIIGFFQYLGFLRPMKLLYRIKVIKKLREAWVLSFYDLLRVGVVLAGVWTMFAIFGMTLFKNQFSFCDDPMNFGVNRQMCSQNNGTWITYKHNYDNITEALPTLFVVSSFDGWGSILQMSFNSQPSDIGPQPFALLYQTLLFYFVYILIGVMFFVSFLTGLFYVNIRTHENQLENQELSQQQIEFMKLAEVVFNDHPQFSTPPKSFLRRTAQKISASKKVSNFLFMLVLLDVVCQLMYRTDVSNDFLRNLNKIYQSISVIFVFWIISQLLTHGWRRYFELGWRQFEFFLGIINLIDFILDFSLGWFEVYLKKSSGEDYFQIIRFFLALRDLRMLLFFKQFVQLKRLIRVMVFALPFLGKFSVILFSVFVCFSLLGCELYGGIYKGEVLDDLINFRNFTNSMLTLFKVSSCDNWRTIMTDLMQFNPYCPEDSAYCGRPVPQIYFISFMILVVWCLFNPLVLGIVQQFEDFHALEISCIQMYVENIDDIKTVWCKYTADTQGVKMHIKFLSKFLLDIGQPFGGRQGDNLWDVAKMASSFRIRVDAYGYFPFNLLMYEMIRTKFKEKVFKKGSPKSIITLKSFDEVMTYKLVFRRLNRYEPRAQISPFLSLRGNVNILRDYLSVLILFKSWQSYTHKLFQKARAIRLNTLEVFTEVSSNHQSGTILDISSRPQKRRTVREKEQTQNHIAIHEVAHLVTESEKSEINQKDLNLMAYKIFRDEGKKRFRFQTDDDQQEKDIEYQMDDILIPLNQRQPPTIVEKAVKSLVEKQLQSEENFSPKGKTSLKTLPRFRSIADSEIQ